MHQCGSEELQIKKALVLVPTGLRCTQRTAVAGEGRGLGGIWADVEDSPPSGADANADSDLSVSGQLCISSGCHQHLEKDVHFARDDL